MTAAKDTVNIETLRRGIEGRDAALLAGLYAEDAVMRIVDRDHPPSRPRVLEGRTAIGAYYEDVCGRNMNHRVESPVAGEGRLAFTEACQYPDGTRVLCATVLNVRDGHIVEQVAVQAWDA